MKAHKYYTVFRNIAIFAPATPFLRALHSTNLAAIHFLKGKVHSHVHEPPNRWHAGK